MRKRGDIIPNALTEVLLTLLKVKELGDLFTDRFGFDSKILTLNDSKKPQIQLNRGITNFVYEHDGSCRTHLLIVYYTGHGVCADEEGLDITGYALLKPRYLTSLC